MQRTTQQRQQRCNVFNLKTLDKDNTNCHKIIQVDRAQKHRWPTAAERLVLLENGDDGAENRVDLIMTRGDV